MTTGDGVALDTYTRLYKDHHAGLLAYARTLTGDASQAEDLVAEARFRVWRRLRAGQRIDDVPGQLRETTRLLAADLAGADAGWARAQGGVGQVAQVTAVLSELPQRWLRALWLTEVEGRSVEGVARDLGTGRSAAGVLVHQAREGLRQGLLRTAQHRTEPIRWSGIEPGDRQSRLREQSLAALTGPALLSLADTAAGTVLLSLAATAPLAVVAAGATRVTHRAVVSHRGPRRRQPLRMAAVGGLVAAGAGMVTALALTGAAPAPHSAAAAPAAQPTTTSPVGPGPLAAQTTPLRATPTTPAPAPASTGPVARFGTSSLALPTSAAPAHVPTLTRALPATAGTLPHASPTAPQLVASAPSSGSPSATRSTRASATPGPAQSTTPTRVPSPPATTSSSGSASATPSTSSTPTSTPTATPTSATTSPSGSPSSTGTPSATSPGSATTAASSSASTSTSSSASSTASGSATPSGSTTP